MVFVSLTAGDVKLKAAGVRAVKPRAEGFGIMLGLYRKGFEGRGGGYEPVGRARSCSKVYETSSLTGHRLMLSPLRPSW